jgi:protein ImuB
MRTATRDARHLKLLLAEHLNRTVLPAPVTGIKLRAENLQAYTGHSASLLITPNSAQSLYSASDAFELLLEQLQARLGREAIQQLQLHQDHRPEYVQRFTERSMEKAAERSGMQRALLGQCRPLWLLPKPQPLYCQNRIVYYQGPVSIIAGPERIESGWWHTKDIRRDYYLATDRNASKLWIYKDLTSGKWYLHGLFA